MRVVHLGDELNASEPIHWQLWTTEALQWDHNFGTTGAPNNCASVKVLPVLTGPASASKSNSSEPGRTIPPDSTDDIPMKELADSDETEGVPPPKKGKGPAKSTHPSKRPLVESPQRRASRSKRSRPGQQTGPKGYDFSTIEVEEGTVISKELLPLVEEMVRCVVALVLTSCSHITRFVRLAKTAIRMAVSLCVVPSAKIPSSIATIVAG